MTATTRPTPAEGWSRRRLLALGLLGVPAIAALLGACSDDDDDDDGPSPTPGAAEARSAAARRATTSADAGSLPGSYDRFAMDLYRILAGAEVGNLVVSPASIALALSMVTAGAAGTTRDELLATLHVDEVDDDDALARSANALAAELDRRNSADLTLRIANSVWAQSGMSIGQPFLDTLAQEYGAGVRLADFRGDADRARHTVNAWVDEQTGHRIPELLGEGTVEASTRMVLANAVYLKAAWATPFDPERTEEGTFATSGDDLVRVPMMHMTEHLDYAAGDGWQAVQLPYAGGDLALLIYLPEPGFLADFEQIFLWSDATRYLERRPVTLTMPRVDIGAAVQLRDVLDAIGIHDAFTDRADFTAITRDEPLHVGDVIHQANITIDEHGTEAAAATAIGMATGAAPDPEEPVEVRCDRPFVFVLRDLPTDTVLFLGRVGVPQGA